MNKDKVLIALGIYRSGEKIIPIIPELKKHCDVDVMFFFQMNKDSKWFGDIDHRLELKTYLENLGVKVFQGPGENEFRTGSKNILNNFDFSKYKIIIIDDNIAKSSWGTVAIAEKGKQDGCIVIGSPHGNHEFDRLNFDKKINNIFDYIFVFGEKEQNLFTKKDKIIPTGIPSNDCLCKYERKNEYILMVMGYLPNCPGNHDYDVFTEKSFIKSKVLELSEKYGKKILIKEKSRHHKGLKKYFQFLEDKYENVKVIMDVKDDNEMSSNAFLSLSAPSTLSFKTIQIGIPTILFKNHGMTGNFYDYDGLVDLNSCNIEDEVKKQIDKGRDEKFLKETLECSLDFSSTNKYFNKILEIKEKNP